MTQTKELGFETTAEEALEGVDLSGKTYLVTGTASGLGLETARVLALRGARVIATARTAEAARAALAEVGASGDGVGCDLSEPASVRACVAEVRALGRTIDGVVCNAGVMAIAERTVKHGLELQFLTNHIGHFALVTGLVDTLADDARVVMVSSGAHFMAPENGIELEDLAAESWYEPWRAYGQSKLANVLMAKELARTWAGTRRTANAIHPGVIRTNLQRHMDPAAAERMNAMKMKSIPQGAATQSYVVAHPALADVSGQYFVDCKPKAARPDADDAQLAKRLWSRSEAILAAL